LAAITLLSFQVNSQAQSAAHYAVISGTVTDQVGAAIPGAHVTVKSADFSSTRALVTSDTGAFTAAMLNPGVYTVEVKAPGFMLKKPARVTLGVGSSVQISIRLGIAGKSENVSVSAHGPTVEGNTLAPAVNKETPQVSNTVAGLTVTYLPNRDRDFTQFGQLAAGVQPAPNSTGLIVDGQRPDAFSAAVDGADFDDPLNGGERGAKDGSLFFPQTVVREFQVIHAGATSQVGGTNAGFVNIVTKEGSNKYHGEAFYIGRPAWTADDPFGHSLDNAQNEFGGSIGGPIKKDRAFFYVGAEQDFVNIPYWTQFEPQAPGTIVPPSLTGLQRQIVGTSDPTSVFARTDFMLNKTNSLNLQFNFNRVNANNIDLSGSSRSIAPIDNSAALTGDSYWVRGNLTTVLGSNKVNQFLAQWAQDQRTLLPNSTSPEFVINGFGVLGGNSIANESYTSNINRYSDDFSVTHGGLILHFGATFAYNPASPAHEANLNGVFDFNSLADYLDGNVRRYQQTFITGNGVYNAAVKNLGFYLDSRFPLNKQLTVTAGLRWDGQWNPQPSNPNTSIAQTTAIPNDLSMWQPRLGLAWNPKSNTVVRLSAGLYDAPSPANLFQRVFTDNAVNTVVADSYFDPQILPLVTSGGVYTPLASPAGLTLPAAFVVGMSPSFRNPRSFQVAGSVEQQFTPKISVTAGYVHNSTWDLQQLLNQNLFPPTYDSSGMPFFPAQRPDPAVGQLLVNTSSAHSSYDGMLLTANFQLPHRSQLSANYTLARARDDNSNLGPFTLVSALNPFNLAAEAAYSNFDVRNSFNLSAITNLPLGFKINPILIARSGLPYTPIIGFDTQNDADDWNDRAVLGGLVASRNSLRQPLFFDWDIRFVKDITLHGEGHHLDLFLDLFNITNAANRNFGPEAISVFGSAGAPIYSAGQALYAPNTNQIGSPRQIQFTARITAF